MKEELWQAMLGKMVMLIYLNGRIRQSILIDGFGRRM
jgi:hypothetical protein